MAVVLDAFASYICNLLTEMAKEEVGMLLGVPGELQELEKMLRNLSDLLADAERKRITDRAVEGWVGELKDVMYDATDILDLCQLKADERKHDDGCSASSSGFGGCFSGLLSCLRDPLFAYDIGSKIKALNQKLDSISKRSARLGFLNLSSYEDRRVAPHVSRKTSPVLVEADIVGEKIEEDTRMLVDLLTKDDRTDNILVVAIVGVGGIGKTTLAKKIYSDQTIQDEFNKRMWVCISQDFNEVNVLQTVITAAGCEHGGAQARELLEPMLENAVRGKKFLLVVDDIWSVDPWNELLRRPLKSGAQGSRIVITSRDRRVAQRMKAVHCHRVGKLSPEDGWSLLKKTQVISSEQEVEIDWLKDIGLKIVLKCDGLPLAIKIVGGLLCVNDRTENSWLGILNNPTWNRDGMPEHLNNAFCLSYEDLPSHLKQCFLYCSLLPKSRTVRRQDIVSLWVAEGFVQNVGTSKQLEVVGVEYYKELVMRNLLEPDVQYYEELGFTMHDVLRSFAQNVAKDETIVISDEQNSSDCDKLKLRRLCISNKQMDLRFLRNQKSLRTLMISGCLVEQGDISNCLFSLRVLLLQRANFTMLPDSLCHLKHLRYLELSWTNISAIPEDIENLKFLLHIGLVGCKNLSHLPHGIVKLHKLRHLLLAGTSVHKISRGFGSLKNLYSLTGFIVHHDGTANDWCSLQELRPLSQLRHLHLHGLENATSNSMASQADLSTKTQLYELWLSCASKIRADGQIEEGITEEQQQRVEDVLDELCPPPSLELLKIRGYFGRQHAGWMMTPTLKNLRWLKLEDYACCKQLPTSLGQLPNLDYLRINRAPAIERIGHEFIVAGDGTELEEDLMSTRGIEATAEWGGTNMNRFCPSQLAAMAFPKLQTMYLLGMPELEEWEWEQQVQAMPILSTLSIEHCKLRCLPPGLAYQARALKVLALKNVRHLAVVENFGSLVELLVCFNPNLKRIANLPNLQKLTVTRCSELTELEDVAALESIILEDYDIETLPEYLEEAKSRKLFIDCTLELLKLISLRDAGPEWEKIKHIQQVKAYGHKGDVERKWYVLSTREPFSFDTNITAD